MKHQTSKLAVLGIAMGFTLAAAAGEETVVSADRLGDSIVVRDVSLAGGAVRGVVVNNTGQRIEDLTLRVTCNWRWKNEFRPGDGGAGWSTTVPLSATLPPGASHPFEYAPERPFPARDDGYLVPAVSVACYTAYPGRASP